MTTETLKAATPESIFLDNLRTRTSTAHKRLEQLPVSSHILAPSVTKEGYRTYLESMHDVVQSLESTIYPRIASVVPDLESRKKAYKIGDDLAFMGFSALNNPADPFKPDTLSTPFALGIAYVVEGSTLGGRFILKNIQASLGYDENAGATYFAGYGNKTGSSWKSFLDVLTGYAIQNSCADEIIEGARFAFDKIYEHLHSHSRHDD